MQKLSLHEDVFDALKKGKLTTIRKGRRNIALGKLLFESASTKRQQIVEVVSVYYTDLANVTSEDLKNDGFEDHDDMREKMRSEERRVGKESRNRRERDE